MTVYACTLQYTMNVKISHYIKNIKMTTTATVTKTAVLRNTSCVVLLCEDVMLFHCLWRVQALSSASPVDVLSLDRADFCKR